MPPKIQLHCNYCPDIFPNFKLLVDHYKDKHADKLNRYFIKNLSRKAHATIYAPSIMEACQSLGWKIEDCVFKEL